MNPRKPPPLTPEEANAILEKNMAELEQNLKKMKNSSLEQKDQLEDEEAKQDFEEAAKQLNTALEVYLEEIQTEKDNELKKMGRTQSYQYRKLLKKSLAAHSLIGTITANNLANGEVEKRFKEFKDTFKASVDRPTLKLFQTLGNIIKTALSFRHYAPYQQKKQQQQADAKKQYPWWNIKFWRTDDDLRDKKLIDAFKQEIPSLKKPKRPR